MVFGWILVLIAAMVGTRATNKLKRARKNQEGGEYISLDESDSETESVDWDEIMEETAAKTSTASKGKAPTSSKAKTPPTAAEKGKAPMQPVSMKRKTVAKPKGRARGIEIQEPTAREQSPLEEGFIHISTERIKDFEKRECIGERHVNVAALKERSKVFVTLFDHAVLAPICNFPETSGYCLHMVRTFYQCASQLQDHEDGPKEFVTTVRNVKLKITPQLIGEVLGMNAWVEGIHYLKGHVMTNTTWRTVVDGICLPDTRSAGNSVLSKELRPEYRFLNFIVCYNILPNMQTKVLRWDRMLFLYLLGHPAASLGSNFNIPFLIWSRMARYVENAHPTERLPFPLIIMRIFRKFDIDTGSLAYMHSLGTINDSTIVKSLSTRPDKTPTPPRSKRTSAAAARAATAMAQQAASAAASTSADDASVTLIYKEQRRLSSEQERIPNEITTLSTNLAQVTAAQAELKKKQKSLAKLVKKIFQKLGCSSSDDSD